MRIFLISESACIRQLYQCSHSISFTIKTSYKSNETQTLMCTVGISIEEKRKAVYTVLLTGFSQSSIYKLAKLVTLVPKYQTLFRELVTYNQ
jgi:hypothetical protein